MTAPTTPLLTTVPRVELGAVGRWNISNMEGWEPSPGDFASAVAALACPAVRRPVLKFGHDGNHGAGDPAIGYIDNMAVTENGQVLVGDYAGIPAWLGAEDSEGRSVLASAYPDRSGEWQYDYVCQLGHTHPFVLHAMSLLGVERPGIGTLASLHDLYALPPQLAPEKPMPAASLASTDGRVSSAATTDDVRRAYYAGPGSNWDLYIREMYVDPPELIVQNDEDASLSRVAYTIGGDGTVTFADAQPVKVEYVAARVAAGAPVVAYASHTESRPGTRPAAQTPVADPAPETPNQEGVGMDPAQLREALGLAADASDQEVQTAFAAALPPTPNPAPVTPPPAAPSAGVVTIDASTYGEILAAAERTRRLEQRLIENERDAVLSAAVKAGKFAPVRRKHYEQLWASDPEGTKTTVEQLTPNLVPVAMQGYAGGEDDPDLDTEFAGLFPPVRKKG